MGLIKGLNKNFESRVRLGMMSILMVNDWVDFIEMKALLEVTDGNLASHSAALENNGYIKIKKEFVGKKPKTSYQITDIGKLAFAAHLAALEKLMRQ